jgi:hypothetical protein
VTMNHLCIGIFALTLVGCLAFVAASLRWGLKRAAITDISLLRAVGLHFLFSVIVLFIAIILVLLFYAFSNSEPPDLAMNVLGYGLQLVVA